MPDSKLPGKSGLVVSLKENQDLKSEVNNDPMREYRLSKMAYFMFSVELDR